MDKQRFAVIGNPIEHSLSPVIHQQFAQQTNKHLSYEKRLVLEQNFEPEVVDFFKSGGCGLNITRPFKQRAYSMSNERTPRCMDAKSANTLWWKGDKLYADNTDGVGFMRDLQPYIDVAHQRILILGFGGAVRGILPLLLTLNPSQLMIANRDMAKIQSLHEFTSLNFDASCLQSCAFSNIQGEFDIIINGIAGDIHHFPISPSTLSSKPFCYDLNYNQNGLTPFVLWAKAHHCMAVDGFGMLVEQAAEAFYIWHGIMPDVNITKKMRSR